MSEEFNFKNSGKSYNSVVSEQAYSNKNKSPTPIGIKTPLEPGVLNNENLFKMHFSIEDQIEDNFKNLLLTRKGERLNSDFGTNLKEIFSFKDEGDIQSTAMEEVRIAVEKYLPVINLLDFAISEENRGTNDEMIYLLQIRYNISGINNNKTMTLKLKTSG
jgi:phage baseplate assembly protein W